MRTSNIGAIQIIERFINHEYVIIGTFEMTAPYQWWWTCYDASLGVDGCIEKPYHQGCAASRKDAIYYIRKEYREQLKQLKKK